VSSFPSHLPFFSLSILSPPLRSELTKLAANPSFLAFVGHRGRRACRRTRAGKPARCRSSGPTRTGAEILGRTLLTAASSIRDDDSVWCKAWSLPPYQRAASVGGSLRLSGSSLWRPRSPVSRLLGRGRTSRRLAPSPSEREFTGGGRSARASTSWLACFMRSVENPGIVRSGLGELAWHPRLRHSHHPPPHLSLQQPRLISKVTDR
ncbi:unnamed protein product, partial [Urochloa humidicola]